MPINKDGTNITVVKHLTLGGTETRALQVIHMNAAGTQTPVFGAQVSEPYINTPSILAYNSVTFTVLNTYDTSIDLYARVGSQAWVLRSSIPANTTTSYTFNNLISNTTYNIEAYGVLSGHANSPTNSRSITTPLVITATPSISITNTTWNSLTWRITNEDTASALITTALYNSTNTTRIGDVKTRTIAAGGYYDFSESGLSYSTNYYIRRKAAAEDGKIESNEVSSGPHTTSVQPTTPAPTVSVVTSTPTSVTIKVISGSADYYSTIYYSVVPSGQGASGYTTHGTSLPDYYTAPNGVQITLTQLHTGGSFVSNTSYEVYTKTQISGWIESSSVHTDIATTIQYYTVNWYDKDNVNVLSQQIASGTTISTAAINPGVPSSCQYLSGWSPSLPRTITANTNFIPQYLYYYYTVRWENGYDGGLIKSQSYQCGAQCLGSDYPGSPTRAGYTFAGWDTAANFYVTENKTIKALWTPISYPTVSGLNFTVPANNKIFVTYTSNPYHVQLEYDINGDWYFRWLDNQLMSAGETFTVSAGKIRIRARNREYLNGGWASEWVYAGPKTVGGYQES